MLRDRREVALVFALLAVSANAYPLIPGPQSMQHDTTSRTQATVELDA